MTKQLLPLLSLLLLAGSLLVACDSSGPGTDKDDAPDDASGTPNTILVTPSEVTIEKGSTQQFTAEVKDAQDNTLEGVSVVWESDNEAVATIDGDGRADGVAEGTVEIIASAESVSGSAMLTIKVSGGTSEPSGSWEKLDGGLNSSVSGLGVDADGNVVAGGLFTATADGSETEVYGVARWNGSSWEPIGSGFGSVTGNGVVAFAVDVDGSLVAGGKFDRLRDNSSTVVNNIARWNGSSWEPIGSGFNYSVEALIVGPNGNLIAGGRFYGKVARWNGTSWEPIGDDGLGQGISGEVNALALAPNGDIIAGGNFDVTGDGQTVNNIARWNGSSWEAIGSGFLAGSGFEDQVRALTIDANGDLIAGGYFKETGSGLVVNSIARWNGSSWEVLSTGFGDPISAGFTRIDALTLDVDGRLIAGGLFTQTGDGSVTRLNNVARWDPD